VLHTPEHIATSRKLANEGIILLKNQGNLLPLDAGKIKSIAVIGPNADQVQFGDYSWSKSNKHGINFLQALKSQYAGKIAINYAKGCDLVGQSTDGFAEAAKAASASDVAVVVIGDTSMIFSGVGWEDPTLPANGTVGEGFDVTNPVPPGVQEELVKAVVAAGKPTVVILLNGRPYCLPWMHDNVPAIVEAFYPGEQQGSSLVDILFGKVNPSGHLPVTLARSVGQLPCTYDFKGFGRGYYHQPGSTTKPGRDYVFDSPAPLWPFGFGLSYTTFAVSDLNVSTDTVQVKYGLLKFSFEMKNTGKVPGATVAQAYWRQLEGDIAPPEKRLLRFERVELQPGESRTVSYEVPSGEFRSLSVDKHWEIMPGPIEIQIGDNAESITAKKRFVLTE
jgi:beta-glucosidase